MCTMNMFTNALKSIRCFDPTAKKIQTNLIRKRFKGAEGVALWLRALTDFAKDLGLVPRTHIRGLTASCDSSSRGSDAF